MSTATKSGAGLWSCSIKKDKETGLFIGHCLDLHVKVAGRDEKEAWCSLHRVMKAHYEYCYEFDQEGLNLSAPMDDWNELKKALQDAIKSKNTDRIMFGEVHLSLRAPRIPTQELPLSFQGVEIGQMQAAAA
jgi:hypothetical protein